MYALRRHAGLIALASVALILIFVPTAAHADFLGIGGAVTSIVTNVVQLLIELLGKLLLAITDVFLLPIAQYNEFLKSEAVNAGWVVIRDLTNMFFVVMMLVIAFGTILSVEEFSYHTLLPRLLIMAVLINFSKVIAGLFIDLSQVVMLTFVNGFAAAAGANMLNLLQVKNIFEVSQSGFEALSTGDILGSLFLGLAMIGIGLVIVILMTGMLAMRIVMLWALLILSPIAFFLSSFPRGRAKEAYSKWWSMFGNYLTAGPVLAFFLWIAFYTAGSGTLSQSEAFPSAKRSAQEQAVVGGLVGAQTKTGQFFISEAGSEASMVSFIIGIALLMAGMMITQEFSVMGGSALSGAANWMQTKGGAFLKGTAAAPARLAWTGVKYGERKVYAKTGVGLNPMRYYEAFKGWRDRQAKIDVMRGAAHAEIAAERGGRFAPIRTFFASPQDALTNYMTARGIKGMFRTTFVAPREVKSYLNESEEETKTATKLRTDAAANRTLADKDDNEFARDDAGRERARKLMQERGLTRQEAIREARTQLRSEADESEKQADLAEDRAAKLQEKAIKARAPQAILAAGQRRALEAEEEKRHPERGQTAEQQVVGARDSLEGRNKVEFKVRFEKAVKDGNDDDIMGALGYDNNRSGFDEFAEKELKQKLGMSDEEINEFREKIGSINHGKRMAFTNLATRDAQTGQVRPTTEEEYQDLWAKDLFKLGAERMYTTDGHRKNFGYDDKKGKFHASVAGAMGILETAEEFATKMATGKKIKPELVQKFLSDREGFERLFNQARDKGLYSAATVQKALDGFEAAQQRIGTPTGPQKSRREKVRGLMA